MNYFIHAIPILVFLLAQYTTNGTKLCQESVNDIRIVDSCPTSKEEMENAANNKNCTKFAKNRNCTHLEYHCVINTYMNETLEVCAPKRFIFGYCTEFNAVGGVVQRHYAAKCNDKFPKCDRIYISIYAYKYSDCYKLVYRTRDLNKAIPSTFDETVFRKTMITALSIIVSLVSVSLVVAYILRTAKKKGKPQNSIAVNEEYHGLTETIQEAESNPSLVYFFFKRTHFKRFNEVYNQTMDFMHFLENKQDIKEHMHAMTLDVFVKVGVVGVFTESNLKLFSEGKNIMSGGTHNHIWEAVPLLCFQNNLPLHTALETLQSTSACHKILIISEEAVHNDTNEADDSIIIIGQNKEELFETITSCLIQPIRQMEKEWKKSVRQL